jgi:hypothetical protein
MPRILPLGHHLVPIPCVPVWVSFLIGTSIKRLYLANYRSYDSINNIIR